MLHFPTDAGTCPLCDGQLLYGVTEEPSLWKVYFFCDRCDREFLGGRISRSEVEHLDEVYARAERLAETL